VVLIGDFAVGKASLVNGVVEERFNVPEHAATGANRQLSTATTTTTGSRVSDLGRGRSRKVPQMSLAACLLRASGPGSPRSLRLLAWMPPSCYRGIIAMRTKIYAARRQGSRLSGRSHCTICGTCGRNRERPPEGSVDSGDDRR
jgi:hypothetical protein